MTDNATPQESLWIPPELQARVEVMMERLSQEGAQEPSLKVALAYARVSFHNHPQEWDSCSMCVNYSRVFYYTQNRRTEANPEADGFQQNLEYKFCADCIARKAQYRACNRDEVNNFDYEEYSYATNILSFQMFTPEDMPEATQPAPEKCYCGGYIREGQESQGLDKHGTLITSHSRCTLGCVGCNKNYITSGENRVDMRTIASSVYCDTCADLALESGDYSNCDRCSEYFHIDDMNWSDERERDLCNYCYRSPVECGICEYHYTEGDSHECWRAQGDTIYSYNYKPNAEFFGVGKYHLGFELEVEHDDGDCDDNNYTASLIEDKLGKRVYMKYDGSLDSGFEVVTHPHTLDEYKSKDFDWSFLHTLVVQNYVSWNNSNCGFHVHISRTAFETIQGHQAETAHKMRFTKFIYDNQYQVERIAGRKSNDYATFTDKGRILNKVLHSEQRSGRYEVVNVYNEHTYEIRIFKGSLRKERLMSNLEFIHAVCEYTRNMKVVAKHTPFAWSRFIKYVADNDSRYPNLMLIINEAFSQERIKSEV